jgi:hypothetical protein
LKQSFQYNRPDIKCCVFHNLGLYEAYLNGVEIKELEELTNAEMEKWQLM